MVANVVIPSVLTRVSAPPGALPTTARTAEDATSSAAAMPIHVRLTLFVVSESAVFFAMVIEPPPPNIVRRSLSTNRLCADVES